MKAGIETYGTPLESHNGRDALQDAYEEALDLACYLKQAMIEREPLNQCDGCRRGIPNINGIHRGDSVFDMIACTADRYQASAPSQSLHATTTYTDK
jgi:hypothetical protein